MRTSIETIFSILYLLAIVHCAANKTHLQSSTAMPTWKKLYIVGSFVIITIAAILYRNRNRLRGMQEILRGYMSTGQA